MGEDRPAAVRRVVFRALAQACSNLGLYVEPEAKEYSRRLEETEWVPLEQLQRLLDLAAVAYPEPGPVLERLGREMVRVWYHQGDGRRVVRSGLDFLRMLSAGRAYRQIVCGPDDVVGTLILVRLDQAAGVAVVQSTTPFSRDLERGVLRAGARLTGDQCAVEVTNAQDPNRFEIEFMGLPTSRGDEFVDVRLADLLTMKDVGENHMVKGRELRALVASLRDAERENGRSQALWRTTNAALTRALAEVRGEHRVVTKLASELKQKTAAQKERGREVESLQVERDEARDQAFALLDHSVDRLPGCRVLGRYEVVRRRGHGEAATVFDVIDTHRRALCTLRLLRVLEPDLVPVIQSTVERIGSAGLPGIPKVHSVGLLDGVVPCIVTDRAPGRGLRRILSQRGRPSPSLAATVARLLSGVLAVVHERGLAHGGVRPETVIVTHDGIRLVELELSNVCHRLRLAPEARVYCSPERWFEGELRSLPSPSDDVYAVGSILFELLTGRHPSAAPTLDCDPGLADLCLSALAQEPEERPRAVELARALAAWGPRERLNELLDGLSEEVLSGDVRLALRGLPPRRL